MQSIKKEFVLGVVCTAIAKYSSFIVLLIVSSVLSRLLAPEDFGVMSIAMIFIVFFNVLGELGIVPAIIQNQELTEKNLYHIFSFTIWVGLIISLLFYIFSYFISYWYKSEKLLLVCHLLSINSLFVLMNIVPSALIQKEKRFKFIAIRTVIVQFIGGFISCIIAYFNGGIYSLVITPIFSSICIFIINYKEKPQKIVLKFEMESVKIIASYSIYQFLYNFVNYLTRNFDKVLIGKFLDMSQLGYYEKSYQIMQYPLQGITHIITPVLQPMFYHCQNDIEKLYNYHYKIIKVLSFLGFPLSAFLFFSSEEIIFFLFGEQWKNSIPIFKVLSITVGFQILLSSSGSFFQITNKMKQLFIYGGINSAILVISVSISLIIDKTILSVSFAWLITVLLGFVNIYYILIHKILNASIKRFVYELIYPLIISFVLGLLLYNIEIYIYDLVIVLKLIIKLLFSIVFTFISWIIVENVNRKMNMK